MENIVCDLEYAKELAELKILKKIKTHFMWVKYEMWDEPKVWQSDMASDIKITCLSGKREFAYQAPTVSELGEIMPETISRETVGSNENNRVEYYKRYNQKAKNIENIGLFYTIRCSYYGYTREDKEHCDFREIFIKDKKEANARAKFLIEFKKIKKFNKHLF